MPEGMCPHGRGGQSDDSFDRGGAGMCGLERRGCVVDDVDDGDT